MTQIDKEFLLANIFSSLYTNNTTISGPYGDRLLTYSDYIASGQPLKIIEEFIQKKVFPFYANTHTEASFTGFQTSHLREEARDIIKNNVNATEDDVVIFCGSGSTAAMDKVSRLLNIRAEKGEKIIIFHGPYEHHSNLLPWREGKFEVVAVDITDEGLLDLNDLEDKLKKHQGKGTLIGSFSAASNVTGIISPVEKIASILHSYGALSFWDYAAGAPYMNIDMNPVNGVNKDVVFISTHKFVGGPGTPGILIAKKSIFTNEIPIVPSGGTVEFVTKTKQSYYEDIETREEGGTPGIIETIRAGLSFKLKAEIGEEYIDLKETAAVEYAFKELGNNPNVYLLGNTDCKRLAFFAFHIRNNGKFLHHNFVVALLNDLFGIQARGGCSCAGPYGHDLFHLRDEDSEKFMCEIAKGNNGMKPGWTRLNLNYFIPEHEMKFIVKAIQWIAEYGYLLLKEYQLDDKTGQWNHNQFKKRTTNNLSEFSIRDISESSEEPSLKFDRKTEQNSYFEAADRIAANAKDNWENIPCQSYQFEQIENSLRWFTLAQDIVMKNNNSLIS